MRLLLAVLCALTISASANHIWPPPQLITTSGPARAIAAAFNFSTPHVASKILNAALERHTAILRQRSVLEKVETGPAAALEGITVVVADDAEAPLRADSDYSYSLRITSSAHGLISAPTVWGALYGLESFTQLASTGALSASGVHITDAPQYNWRGLMIDSGRRFFPMPLVENLLDTMAALKMNVLHLHASDHCRSSPNTVTACRSIDSNSTSAGCDCVNSHSHSVTCYLHGSQCQQSQPQCQHVPNKRPACGRCESHPAIGLVWSRNCFQS
jgi:hypothetical protein